MEKVDPAWIVAGLGVAGVVAQAAVTHWRVGKLGSELEKAQAALGKSSEERAALTARLAAVEASVKEDRERLGQVVRESTAVVQDCANIQTGLLRLEDRVNDALKKK